MKTLRIALILAFAFCGAIAAARAAETEAELVQEIRRLDMAHARAIFKGDAAALDQLMDDEVTVNHPTNRIVKEKKELLDLIAQGVIRYTAFERRPEKFLVYDGLVVVMGDETVVPAKGAPNEGKQLRRRYTNGWMKRDGRWRLAFRHANNVCAPCQAAR